MYSLRGMCLSHHLPTNQRCFVHNSLWGSTTPIKLAVQNSPGDFEGKTYPHRRHATPRLSHTTTKPKHTCHNFCYLERYQLLEA
jgi:hypothetical protein